MTLQIQFYISMKRNKLQDEENVLFNHTQVLSPMAKQLRLSTIPPVQQSHQQQPPQQPLLSVVSPRGKSFSIKRDQELYQKLSSEESVEELKPNRMKYLKNSYLYLGNREGRSINLRSDHLSGIRERTQSFNEARQVISKRSLGLSSIDCPRSPGLQESPILSDAFGTSVINLEEDNTEESKHEKGTMRKGSYAIPNNKKEQYRKGSEDIRLFHADSINPQQSELKDNTAHKPLLLKEQNQLVNYKKVQPLFGQPKQKQKREQKKNQVRGKASQIQKNKTKPQDKEKNNLALLPSCQPISQKEEQYQQPLNSSPKKPLPVLNKHQEKTYLNHSSLNSQNETITGKKRFNKKYNLEIQTTRIPHIRKYLPNQIRTEPESMEDQYLHCSSKGQIISQMTPTQIYQSQPSQSQQLPALRPRKAFIKRQYTSLQRENQELILQNEFLRRQNGIKTKEIEKSRKTLDPTILAGRLEEVKNELRMKDKDNEKLRKELIYFNKLCKKLEKKEDTDHQENYAKLAKELYYSNELLREAKKKNVNLAQELSRRTEELNVRSKELASLRLEYETMSMMMAQQQQQQVHDKYNHGHHHNTNLEEKVQEQDSQLIVLTAKLQNSRSEEARLRGKMATMNSRMDQLVKDNQKLRQDLRQKGIEMAALKDSIDRTINQADKYKSRRLSESRKYVHMSPQKKGPSYQSFVQDQDFDSIGKLTKIRWNDESLFKGKDDIVLSGIISYLSNGRLIGIRALYRLKEKDIMGIIPPLLKKETLQEKRLQCFGSDYIQFIGGSCSDRGIESLILVTSKREILKCGIQSKNFNKFNMAITQTVRPTIVSGCLGLDESGIFLSQLRVKLEQKQ